MTTANDWTKEMSTKGFPELQQLYALLGKPEQRHARPRRTIPAQLQRRLALRVLHMAQRPLQTRCPPEAVNRKRLRAAQARPANRVGQRSSRPNSHGPRLRTQAPPLVHRRCGQTNPRGRQNRPKNSASSSAPPSKSSSAAPWLPTGDCKFKEGEKFDRHTHLEMTGFCTKYGA